MSWFRRQPEPPKNCTITRTNGEVIPLEFVYEGRQRIEGSRRKIHVWQAVTKTYVEPPFAMDGVIPPRTQIRWSLLMDPKDLARGLNIDGGFEEES